jgi:hypothetical protein
MNTDQKARQRAEVIDEVSKWGVGAGILTVALAPLAIPILILTAAFALPLLLPLIPIALIAGLVYLPVRLVRAIRRRRHASLGRGSATDEQVLVGVKLAPAHHRLVK